MMCIINKWFIFILFDGVTGFLKLYRFLCGEPVSLCFCTDVLVKNSAAPELPFMGRGGGALNVRL